MARTVFGNAELAHVWANSYEKYERRSSSMYANGDLMYSYGTVIAQLDRINGICFVSTYYHSNTTSKHQGHVLSATRHYKRIYIPVSDFHREDGSDIIKIMEEDIDRLILKQARARTADYSDEIERDIENLKAFADYHKIDAEKEIASLRSKLDNIAEITAKLKEEKSKLAAQTRQQLRSITPYTKEIVQDIIYSWRNNSIRFPSSIWNIETFIKDHCSTEIKDKFGELTRTIANKFMSNILSLINEHDRIRSDGDMLKTSRNATVKLSEAAIIYRKLKQNQDVVGHKVGDIYTVTSKSNDTLTIGCHKFKISEELPALEHILLECGMLLKPSKEDNMV